MQTSFACAGGNAETRRAHLPVSMKPTCEKPEGHVYESATLHRANLCEASPEPPAPDRGRRRGSFPGEPACLSVFAIRLRCPSGKIRDAPDRGRRGFCATGAPMGSAAGWAWAWASVWTAKRTEGKRQGSSSGVRDCRNEEGAGMKFCAVLDLLNLLPNRGRVAHHFLYFSPLSA